MNDHCNALEPPASVLSITEEQGISHALFREHALAVRAFHSRAMSWPTDLERFPDLGKQLVSARNGWCETQVVSRGGVLCHVRLGDGWVRAMLATADRALLDRAERELRELIPRPSRRPDEEPQVVMRFWNSGPTGAWSRFRRVAVPRWREIRANYPDATIASLEQLMDDWQPDGSGQLVLWHGPPGTGKTHALRALAWEWRGWCEPHYIIDPEIFFGGRPDYMLEVLLDEAAVEEDPTAVRGRREEQPPRWRPAWRSCQPTAIASGG